jgi:hypothetical protein
MFTRERARTTLKRKGWTYRTAAPHLSVTYQHLCLVLTGKRSSARLLERIAALPAGPKTTTQVSHPKVSPAPKGRP